MANAIGLRAFDAEACPDCGTHPHEINPEFGGDRNAVVPNWVWCRVCDLIEQAKAAGPPDSRGEREKGRGWRIVLERPH